MTRVADRSSREKLVEAAATLFHRRGIEATTLKDVAIASGVPIGSVFYYYPSKDDLIAEVIARRTAYVVNLLERHPRGDDPVARLCALVDIWMADRDIDAQFGCPIGSLCFEVARARRLDATAPFQSLIGWAEGQFRGLGAGSKSRVHGVHLIAALQGISLMASVMSDPGMIAGEVNYLKTWIRSFQSSEKHPRRQSARRSAERAAPANRSRST